MTERQSLTTALRHPIFPGMRDESLRGRFAARRHEAIGSERYQQPLQPSGLTLRRPRAPQRLPKYDSKKGEDPELNRGGQRREMIAQEM